MNISTLEQFVEQQNRWRGIFGSKPLTLMSAKDRQLIADEIDMALSPENLHCDGEITASQARKKYQQLTRAARELISIDPNVKFWEYSE